MRAKMDIFMFFINKGMLNPKNAGTIFFNKSFILHFEFQNGRHFNHIFKIFTCSRLHYNCLALHIHEFCIQNKIQNVLLYTNPKLTAN